MIFTRWLRHLWQMGVDTDRYKESTLDLMKRKAVEAGLDPSWFDELANMPSEPGSRGPGDPGRISSEPRKW